MSCEQVKECTIVQEKNDFVDQLPHRNDSAVKETVDDRIRP